MRRWLIAWMLIWVMAPGAWARDARDWGNVGKLKVGTAVLVALKSGEVLRANFEWSSDASVELIMLDGSGTREVARDEVRRITRLAVRSRATPAIVMFGGAAVGAGIGAIAGASGSHHDTGGRAAEGAAEGALLGFLAGGAALLVVTAVQAGKFQKEKVVYSVS
jgi:hypothetical protein